MYRGDALCIHVVQMKTLSFRGCRTTGKRKSQHSTHTIADLTIK